jgi:hypothetical protein
VFVPRLSLLSSLFEIAFWLSPVFKSILKELVPSPESPPLVNPLRNEFKNYVNDYMSRLNQKSQVPKITFFRKQQGKVP